MNPSMAVLKSMNKLLSFAQAVICILQDSGKGVNVLVRVKFIRAQGTTGPGSRDSVHVVCVDYKAMEKCFT